MDISHDALNIQASNTINQRRKGAENEVAVAKWLAAWCANDFGRVPRSGAMRWRHNVHTIGDVVCTDTEFNFPFIIETKFYKSLNVKPFLGKKNKIYGFWGQVTRDSLRIGHVKHRMMLLRHNDMPKKHWYVVVDEIGERILIECARNRGYEMESIFFGICNNERIFGFTSDDVRSMVDYEQFAVMMKYEKTTL